MIKNEINWLVVFKSLQMEAILVCVSVADYTYLDIDIFLVDLNSTNYSLGK